MKKILCLILISLLIFCACENNSGISHQPVGSEVTVNNASAITIEDLKIAFEKENPGCAVTDCVIASDNAYGLIGVVQYTNQDKNPTCLSFISDGFSQPVGLDADNNSVIASESELTYLGNGAVSLLLYNNVTGETLKYVVTYSYDKNAAHTHIKTESLPAE